MSNKCGTCIHFQVRNTHEAEIAKQGMHISDCKPGAPHCMGGQVRGACGVWMQRAENDLPMPWGEGPLVESTFSCELWEPGGPSLKRAGGSFNKLVKRALSEGQKNGLKTIAGVVVIGLISSFTGGKRHFQMKIGEE